MIQDLIQNRIQKQFVEDTKEYYFDLLDSFRESSNEESETDLTPNFLNFFRDAIHSDSLDKFNTQNFYFFSLLQKIVHILSLHEELVISDTLELSDSEDELFNLWHDSEFAKDFLIDLNESKDLLNISKKYLELLEEQCESFFNIHISKLDKTKPGLRYQIIPEIGDSESRIHSLRSNSFSDETFNLASISIGDIDFNSTNKTLGKLWINSSSKQIDRTISTQKERIKTALETIELVNKDLLKTFKEFTKIIVPIDEEGIVSYSMQSLPYVSCINLYHRDFLDLMDDLLHENGHHYLNFILNTNELIYEDNEKIYYSAWRRALRPVRGIYHAYFTFYWAFKLYKSLYFSEVSFAGRDNQKISQRLLEEALMLDFTWLEISRCFDDEKVSKFGLELVKPIQTEITQFMDNDFQNIMETINKNYPDTFQSLKKLDTELKEAKITYII